MTIQYTVMCHPFHNLDEDNNLCRETGKPVASQEHCESGDEDGWNVWLRRDPAPSGGWNAWLRRDPAPSGGEPFDSVHAYEADFNTAEAAAIYANALAVSFRTEVDIY